MMPTTLRFSGGREPSQSIDYGDYTLSSPKTRPILYVGSCRIRLEHLQACVWQAVVWLLITFKFGLLSR
jgi:hypothetical protein